MNVDRCVCFNVTFERLHEYVDRHGGADHVDLNRLQRDFNCGRGCGLCIPYIKLMLQTGRTSFPVHPPADSGASP